MTRLFHSPRDLLCSEPGDNRLIVGGSAERPRDTSSLASCGYNQSQQNLPGAFHLIITYSIFPAQERRNESLIIPY